MVSSGEMVEALLLEKCEAGLDKDIGNVLSRVILH